jgi:anthranilate synthase component 1
VVVETSTQNPLDFISDYQQRLPWHCGLACRAFVAVWRAIAMTLCVTSKSSRTLCPPDTPGCPDILLLQCEELAVIGQLVGQALSDRLR